MDKHVLIVGAGLAGTTCAYLLRQEGLQVTLLERGTLAGKEKLCGGLMTSRSMGLASRLLGTEVNELFRSEFNLMRCLIANRQVDIRNVHLRSLQRSELDRLALERCLEAGAQVIEQFYVHGVDVEHKTVTGRHNGQETVLAYDELVVADGALSSTRELLTGSKPDAVLSLETEVEVSGEPLTVLYTPQLFGYCWYIPAGERAKIGCVSYRDASQLEPHLHAFAERMGVQLPAKHRGAFLPTGKGVLLKAKGALLLGDAAGLICPPTGEGIYYALKSAQMAARAIANHASYEQLMRTDAKTVAREYRTRDLFFADRFIDAGLGLAERTPYGSERAVRWALRRFCSF